MLGVLIVVAYSCMPPPPPAADHVDARVEPLTVEQDEYVRAPEGDFALPIPQGWTLLPPPDGLAEGTLGVLLDSTKRAAVILQRLQLTKAIASALERNDVRSLARACFERRLQRTGNIIRILSDFRVVARDSLRIGTYEFVETAHDSSALRRTRIAVVPTPTGSVVEVALSPIVLSLDRMPEEHTLDSLFVFIMQVLQVP